MNAEIIARTWFEHCLNGWIDFTEDEISAATLAVMEVVRKEREVKQ